LRVASPGTNSAATGFAGWSESLARSALFSLGETGKPGSPRLIGQFSELVFTELVSHGKN
jgi:hypothetical protein